MQGSQWRTDRSGAENVGGWPSMVPTENYLGTGFLLDLPSIHSVFLGTQFHNHAMTGGLHTLTWQPDERSQKPSPLIPWKTFKLTIETECITESSWLSSIVAI